MQQKSIDAIPIDYSKQSLFVMGETYTIPALDIDKETLFDNHDNTYRLSFRLTPQHKQVVRKILKNITVHGFTAPIHITTSKVDLKMRLPYVIFCPVDSGGLLLEIEGLASECEIIEKELTNG